MASINPEIPQIEPAQEEIDLIAQLKEQGTPTKDIARQVLTQNFDFPTKTLTEELGLTGSDIGAIKGTLKMEEKGRRTRSAITAKVSPVAIETAEAKTPSLPRRASPRVTPADEEEAISSSTPAGREFASAIDQVLDKVTTKWKNFIVKLYELQPPAIRQNRGQLENFLYRHGLTGSQIAGILDLTMPVPNSDFSLGSQNMMAINPQTGQPMPIIIMGQGGQQGQPQGGPYIINPPPQNQQSSMSREEITLTIRDTITQEMNRIEASKPCPVPQPAPPHVPYRRIPIMDESGIILKDASGQVVYQEVPYDPSMTMLEFLKPLFLQRPAPVKEVDEEKMLLKTREAFREEMKGQGNKPAEIDIEKLVMKLTADIDAKLGPRLQSLEAESAARDRHQEISQAVRDATAPLVAQVQQLSSNQGLTLEERKVKQLTDTVTSTAKDLRADLRAVISQALVPTYAQMEKQYNLPEGSLVGPLLDQVKKEAPLPTAGDASRILAGVEGWAKS